LKEHKKLSNIAFVNKYQAIAFCLLTVSTFKAIQSVADASIFPFNSLQFSSKRVTSSWIMNDELIAKISIAKKIEKS